ncbi:MAG TPA: ParB/RepB/Spo0J family partition protein [Acidimicrobiales bacterium]|nr:ParB/RepB/Spo0J family partition protein [Acidimicrobiales bacterium]
MARPSGLGRGLEALIPNDLLGDRGSALLDVPINSIRPNPHQPRSQFDEEELASLTASIRAVGVLQPVLLRTTETDQYELVAGERRWRAARRAGLHTIPALVRTVDDLGSVEQALIENLHRVDLNPLEEAAAYQQLIEDFGLTHEQMAARVGRSRAAISNTLRLFQLPPSIQRLVMEGQLSAGHARALLGTPDRNFQEALARRVVAEELSVRAVEEAVRERTQPASPGPASSSRTGRLRPPGVVELESLLSQHLDTRVKVDMGARKGRVVVEFATLEDLERIYRAMTEPPPA